jgi:hypothetical protein
LLGADLILVAVLAKLASRRDVGQVRFFENQTYHFQTLRVFNDIAAGGAETGEILEATRGVKAGDAQSWYAGWDAAGRRALALADTAPDRRSRGSALMRAHTYFRTAQFLLPPDDHKRPPAFERDNRAFYEGLKALGVVQWPLYSLAPKKRARPP